MAELEKCDSCDRPIRWVTTEKGKGHPLNPDPDLAGLFVFVAPGVVRQLKKDERATWSGERWMSHYAICPYSRRSAGNTTSEARARTQERFDAETRRNEEPIES